MEKGDCMDPKALFIEGASFWLQANFDRAMELFKAGGNCSNGNIGYQALCMAMCFYECAPEGSEHGSAQDYHNAIKMFFHAFMGKALWDNVFAIYYMGDTAAKIGTAFENKTGMHALFHAVYRELSLILLRSIVEADNFLKLLSKIEPTDIRKKINLVEKIHKERNSALLDFNSINELKGIRDGKIELKGIIGYLLKNDANVISTLNSQHPLPRFLWVCNAISSSSLKEQS